MIFLYILLFAVALTVCVWGGNIFVDSATKFAKRLHIPLIIIGVTIVAIATNLPEIVVSSVSSATGSYDLAVGDAVGSTICNIALVSGLSITCLPMIIKEKTSTLNYVILLLSIILLMVFGFNASGNFSINWIESIVFTAIFIVFMVTSILDAKKQQSQEVTNETNDTAKTESTNTKKQEKLILIILLLILGAGMVTLGATLMVESAKKIAHYMHMSEAFVGLTIVAIGTSLPELVTTIISIRKKSSELGYGNIIGSNIINCSLLIGLSGLISGTNGLSISKWTYLVSIPLSLIITLIFIIPVILKKRSYRWQGILLLSIYSAYIAFLIVMSSLGIAI